MALGSAQITITTAANNIPEIWGPMVIKATEDNLVFFPLTWDWSGDLATNGGDTVHVPNVSNLTSNAKSANTQVTLNAPTEGVIDLSVNRHDECSFMLEDIVKVQSSFNLSMYYTEKAGFAIAKQMDTRVNTLVSGLSQIVGSAGVDIGDSQIRDGIEFLDLAIAPLSDRNLVIYPDQKNALFGIEKYFRADYRGDGKSTVLVNGRFGEIYGVNVFVSTNIGTNGSPAARLNAMFHKECFASAKQLGPRVQSDYIIEYLGTLVVNDAVYGVVEARDPFGVWFKS